MEKKTAGTGKRQVRLTAVSTFHYFRLVYRSALLLAVLVLYIRSRIASGGRVTDILEKKPAVLAILWLVFSLEMILMNFLEQECLKEIH